MALQVEALLRSAVRPYHQANKGLEPERGVGTPLELPAPRPLADFLMVIALVAPQSIEETLDRYLANLSRNEKTQRSYAIYARAFLEHSGCELTRAAVLSFLEAVLRDDVDNPLPRQRPARASSRRLYFAIIRGVFVANGATWPFRRGEAPRVRERELSHVALAPVLVKKTIDVAIAGGLATREAAFFALASIYGFRKMELAAVRPDNLDLDGRTLYCSPEKGGVERYHRLADAILPFLKSYDFTEVLTEAQADYSWEKIERAMKYPRVRGMGWHCIRRSLVTFLEEKEPLPRVRRFLRWSGGDRDMATRYNSVQFVGELGTTYNVDEAYMTEDEKIFQTHPFLPMWKGEASWAYSGNPPMQHRMAI